MNAWDPPSTPRQQRFLAVRSALFMMRRSRGFRGMLLIAAVVPVIAILARRLQDMRRAAEQLLQGGGSSPDLINAYPVAAEGAGYGFLMLGICAVIWGSATTARQFESTHIRFVWTQGVSRPSWFLSHTASLALAVLLCEVVMLSSAVATGAYFYDFGPIMEQGVEIWSQQEVLPEVGLAILCVSLPLMTALCVGVVTGLLHRSVGFATTTALLVTLALDVYQDVFSNSGRYLYVSYLPSLRDHSYWVELQKLLKAFADVGFSPERLQLNFTVPLIEGVALLCFGFILTLWKRG